MMVRTGTVPLCFVRDHPGLPITLCLFRDGEMVMHVLSPLAALAVAGDLVAAARSRLAEAGS